MEAQLCTIWIEAGRPGAAKLYAAARRRGLDVKRPVVDAFVKQQETRQVFAPGPKSQGKVTATNLDDRWQVDLIDWKQMDASKNKGFKNTLVVVDVFSRYAWAVPMESKSQEEAVKAFRKVLTTSGRKPAEVDSDNGLEFGASFTEFLESKQIAHRTKQPGHVNALAVVDVVIKRLKETLRQELADAGSQSWMTYLPRAVQAYNSVSHEHLMGSTPADVKSNGVLQFALEKEAGRDAATNQKQHRDRVAALQVAGAFRVLLPTKTFTRTSTARWSNEVHKVAGFSGPEVIDEKGARFPVRDTLPVPINSKVAKASVDAGGDAKRAAATERMRAFAQVLNGFLGAEGLTLQGAGTKMRQTPGFNDAMTEAKITGVGALERFIRLFPDMFVVEGEGQKKKGTTNVILCLI